MRWLGTAAPATGEKVHVNVVDDLPSLGTTPHQEPVAAVGEPLRLAERPGGEEAMAQRLDVARLHHHDRRDVAPRDDQEVHRRDRKSTRLNSSHPSISYAVFCLKKKKNHSSTKRTSIQPHILPAHTFAT